MELRQLRYFLVLAEELHFARAAERLGIAQPSLSTQLQALEATLGTKLLARTQRAVHLTPAGELFREEARLTIAQADRAFSIGRRAGRGEIGTLRIAMAIVTSLSGVPSEILEQYRRRYPEIDIQLALMSTNEQLASLRSNALDIGFMVMPSTTIDGAERIKLASNTLVVALPEDNLLIHKETLFAADLRNEPFLVLNSRESTGIQENTQLLGETGKFSPQIFKIAHDLLALLSLVSAGVGAAVVADSVCRIQMPKVIYRRIDDFSPSIDLNVVYRNNDSDRPTRAFLEMCLAHIPKPK
jgi:DNA-binding transcriptional LysR family regulator